MRCNMPSSILCAGQTESNSSDVYKIAIFPQSSLAIVRLVALLTGRVYQDGLGGLRAVLFTLQGCSTATEGRW